MSEETLKEIYKGEYTIIAKFMSVKPCGRCDDPYCVNNLPYYEQWDNLIPAYVRWLSIVEQPGKYSRNVYDMKRCFIDAINKNDIEEAIKKLSKMINATPSPQ